MAAAAATSYDPDLGALVGKKWEDALIHVAHEDEAITKEALKALITYMGGQVQGTLRANRNALGRLVRDEKHDFTSVIRLLMVATRAIDQEADTQEALDAEKAAILAEADVDDDDEENLDEEFDFGVVADFKKRRRETDTTALSSHRTQQTAAVPDVCRVKDTTDPTKWDTLLRSGARCLEAHKTRREHYLARKSRSDPVFHAAMEQVADSVYQMSLSCLHGAAEGRPHFNVAVNKLIDALEMYRHAQEKGGVAAQQFCQRLTDKDMPERHQEAHAEERAMATAEALRNLARGYQGNNNNSFRGGGFRNKQGGGNFPHRRVTYARGGGGDSRGGGGRTSAPNEKH